MPRFSYKIKDASSKTQVGFVEAPSVKQAQNLLHERGYYIIVLKEEIGSIFTREFKKIRLPFNDLVHFTRQLSTMITAGLTLVESLGILKQQTNSPTLIKLVDQLEGEIRAGKSFAEV